LPTTGKPRQVSQRVLVYEAFCVERKIKKGEFVGVINEDEYDARHSNLCRVINRKDSASIERRDSRTEKPCFWMGGNEIYL
jgi:hypothetical protein